MHCVRHRLLRVAIRKRARKLRHRATGWQQGSLEGIPLQSLRTCADIFEARRRAAGALGVDILAILDPAAYDAWLDPENDDTDELQRLLEPYDPKQMSAKPVSTFVNNARNQGPVCIEPREE